MQIHSELQREFFKGVWLRDSSVHKITLNEIRFYTSVTIKRLGIYNSYRYILNPYNILTCERNKTRFLQAETVKNSCNHKSAIELLILCHFAKSWVIS